MFSIFHYKLRSFYFFVIAVVIYFMDINGKNINLGGPNIIFFVFAIISL